MYAYCGNNPINFVDATGNLPKSIDGLLTAISGLTQMITGAALGATLGWTGFGGIAATFLLVNGAATVASGVAQIVNDTFGTNMCEENLLGIAAQTADEIVWGNPSITPASDLYTIADSAATAYSIVAGISQITVKISAALSPPVPSISDKMATTFASITLSSEFFSISDVLGGSTDIFRTAISIFND